MTESNEVIAVRMPQVNVNDEDVRLVGWRVPDGERAAEGQPLVEVETSKAVDEVPAPAAGFVRHAATEGARIQVGEVFAYLGPSTEAIDAWLAAESSSPTPTAKPEAAAPDITAGALALAQRYGLDPKQICAEGRIRRKDVERYAQEKGLVLSGEPEAPVTNADSAADASAEALPPALLEKVGAPTNLSEHQWAVAQHLARTRGRVVPAHVVMDMPMQKVTAWVDARRKAGTMTGPLPALLWAVGAALKEMPKLVSFRLGRQVYSYRSIDIAYTARSRDGRLFTPVIREVDRRQPAELIEECARLNMAVFRGQLRAEDLAGGCMTVSVLSDQPVLFHIGLQNAYQSALLTMGAIREQVVWSEGKAVPQPTATLTLSYDHGWLDGWEAAAFLDLVRKKLLAIE